MTPSGVGRIYGYARVSTTDQSLDVQLARLEKAGVHPALIFKEQTSGTTTDGRDELKRVLALIGAGDILIVTKLDRLGRSLKDLNNIAEHIHSVRAHLRVLDQPFDTTTPAGMLFYQMLAAFAEFETALRSERQREGIARALSRGKVYKGRPPSIDRRAVLAMKAEGKGDSAIAKALKCDRASVYRIVRENGGMQ